MVMGMSDFFGKTLHGQKYDCTKEIKLIENKSKGDEFTVISNGKSILVTQDFLNDLVIKLRLNFDFFGEILLPKATYENPNVNLRPLEVVGQSKHYYSFITIPSKSETVDANGVVQFEDGVSVVLSDEAKALIEQDGKIGINPYTKQWCSLYEANAQNAYMLGVKNIEGQRKAIQKKIDELSELVEERKKINHDLPLRKGIYVGIIKARLGGLSGNSWGDGQAKNTVVHLGVLSGGEEALKEITSGESLVYVSDFYCSYKPKGRFREVYHHQINLDATKIEETGVTCKACLSKMEKLFK